MLPHYFVRNFAARILLSSDHRGICVQNVRFLRFRMFLYRSMYIFGIKLHFSFRCSSRQSLDTWREFLPTLSFFISELFSTRLISSSSFCCTSEILCTLKRKTSFSPRNNARHFQTKFIFQWYLLHSRTRYHELRFLFSTPTFAYRIDIPDRMM